MTTPRVDIKNHERLIDRHEEEPHGLDDQIAALIQ